MRLAAITLMLVAGDILVICGRSQSIRYQGKTMLLNDHQVQYVFLPYTDGSLWTVEENINTCTPVSYEQKRRHSALIIKTKTFTAYLFDLNLEEGKVHDNL